MKVALNVRAFENRGGIGRYTHTLGAAHNRVFEVVGESLLARFLIRPGNRPNQNSLLKKVKDK